MPRRNHDHEDSSSSDSHHGSRAGGRGHGRFKAYMNEVDHSINIPAIGRYIGNGFKNDYDYECEFNDSPYAECEDGYARAGLGIRAHAQDGEVRTRQNLLCAEVESHLREMWFDPTRDNAPVPPMESAGRGVVMFPWSYPSQRAECFNNFLKHMPRLDSAARFTPRQAKEAWSSCFGAKGPSYSSIEQCAVEREDLVAEAFGYACALLTKSAEWLPSRVLTLSQTAVDIEATLHKRQVAVLIAHAFVGTSSLFVRSNTANGSYNSFFCQFASEKYRDSVGVEKTRCLLNYFFWLRSCHGTLDGCVTIRRVAQLSPYPWQSDDNPLGTVRMERELRIEDTGVECIHADFANERIGGGVMTSGAVQEEIRFLTHPECLVSLLLCQEMHDAEVIHIIGATRFSNYRGYGSQTFRCEEIADLSEHFYLPTDSDGRPQIDVVAFDASEFPSSCTLNQFSPKWIERDLHKAYVAFKSDDGKKDDRSIATGNWGCGAFNGDICLKFIIQIMATTAAKRNMIYCSFNNAFHPEIQRFYDYLRATRVINAELYRAVMQVGRYRPQKVGDTHPDSGVPVLFQRLHVILTVNRARALLPSVVPSASPSSPTSYVVTCSETTLRISDNADMHRRRRYAGPRVDDSSRPTAPEPWTAPRQVTPKRPRGPHMSTLDAGRGLDEELKMGRDDGVVKTRQAKNARRKRVGNGPSTFTSDDDDDDDDDDDEANDTYDSEIEL